jgi:hypothetical protein
VEYLLTWKISLAVVAVALPIAPLSAPVPAAPAGRAAVAPASSTVPRYPNGYRGMALIGRPPGRPPLTPQSIRSSASLSGLPFARVPASATGTSDHRVTIKVLNRRGRAPANPDVSHAILTALDGSAVFNFRIRNGTASGEVPAGKYSVLTYVITPGSRKSFTAVYLPDVSVTRNMALTLDARLGRRIRITADNASARPTNNGGAMALIYQDIGGTQQQVAAFPAKWPNSGEPVYVTPARSAPGLLFRLQARLTRNGADFGSPYIYNVGVTLRGIPRDPSARVITRDMARVRTTYASDGRPACAGGHTLARWPGGLEWGLFAGIGALPAARTEYFSAGVTWGEESAMTTKDCAFLAFDQNVRTDRFAGGSSYTRSWFRAPLGPGGDYDSRLSDGTFQLLVPLLSSSAGVSGIAGPGYSPGGSLTGTTTLSDAGGKTIGTSDLPGNITVTLPPQAARYTAVVNASRHAPYSDRTIRQHDVWTFTSKKPAGAYSMVPLLEILYRTALNSRNQARAGARQTITLLPVNGAAGGEPNGIPAHLARLRRVTLQISYDNGSTWQAIPVRKTSSGLVAETTNPTRPRARFASLRVTAEDTSGRTADQTLIRAYAIKHPR